MSAAGRAAARSRRASISCQIPDWPLRKDLAQPLGAKRWWITERSDLWPSILQSIVGRFCASHGDGGIVHWSLQPSLARVLLSDREFPGSSQILLQRMLSCPVNHLSKAQRASLPLETREQGVDVAVAVLLESLGQKVLLTRRAKTLSIFPSAWVPPGGHIEPDEQLLEAGLRELWEETGLRLQGRTFPWRPLALWESVYPPRLSHGLPQLHHLVVYLHLTLQESDVHLQAKLRPSEAEVTAYAWLDRPLLASLVATEGEKAGKAQDVGGDVPSTVSITELERGSARTVAVPTATFLTAAEDGEPLSAGTKFALRQWLKALAPGAN